MKDMLACFVWLYIFGGVGLYLDKLEPIFIPEVKNYALGRILLFYISYYNDGIKCLYISNNI